MRLTDRIHLVGSGMHGFGLTHPSDCHVYLVDGGSELALVDSGAGVDTPAVLARIDATGLPRDRVRHLFVTHAHADHAGGAAGLRDALGLDVHASPEVAAILRAGDERAASVDVGKAQGGYAPGYVYRAVASVSEVRDGDRVRVGDVSVEVIATPGHSVGHTAYLVHDVARSDLFTGDTLLFGGVIILQNTWDCDLGTHLASLRRLGEHPHDGFFPGHLAFSVSDGSRHLRTALAAMDRGAIPPVFG
jgi:glyoxylase-like metal-dependent hydrolase (beta-lactamase superfamily II)